MFTNQHRILWISVVAACVAVPAIAIVSPRIGRKPVRKPPPVSIDGAKAAATPGPLTKKFDGLIGLNLSRHGFEPAELSRPHGHFMVYVLNHSGIQQLTFRLERAAGRRMREVTLHTTEGAWRDELNLTPGEYRLTVAEKPEWNCVITITP